MRLLAACSTTAAAMILLLVACTAGSGTALGSIPSLTCNNGHWSRQNIAASCLQNACATVN